VAGLDGIKFNASDCEHQYVGQGHVRHRNLKIAPEIAGTRLAVAGAMTSDLRFAWRALWKSPTTTLGAVLALALGIGATTTMFGLLNAVALRPLPYPESDRLVELWGNVERQAVERRGTSIPDYIDWREKSRSFDLMSAWSDANFIRYGGAAPEQVPAELVSGDYFSMLGVEPLAGRVLTNNDDKTGTTLAAVIGERLWERAFGRNPDAIGRSLQLDNQVFTIVGVVPARFRGRSDTSEVWVSMLAHPANAKPNRGSRGFAALARLGPGISLQAAQADVTTVARQLEQAYPDTNEKRGIEVSPLASEVFGEIRAAISLLFGAVGFVLVIACASVASLLLARTESRRREFSLRRAIGADEFRLVRLMLAESAWVVLMGVTAGTLLAMWAGDALIALSPVQLPSFATPGVDWRTFGFVALLGVTITVAIGLSPLRSMKGHSLAQDLREGAVENRGAHGGRTMQVIVAGQVAVTVTLLVGAALFGRSFAALARFDPGFDPNGVLSMRVQLPAVAGAPAGVEAGAPQGGAAGVQSLALLDDLRGLPGVTRAGLTSSVPLVNSSAIFYAAEGMGAVDATNRPRAYFHRVSPGYIQTMGLQMVDGQSFGPTDLGVDSPNIMVTAALARRFWPGQSAVGRRIKLGDLTSQNPWMNIVGVVRDANLRGIPQNPTNDPDIFLPFNGRARAFAVLLRTDGDPETLTRTAADMILRREPGAAVFAVTPMKDLVSQQLSASRFLTWLTSVFAGTALTLAIIGIYGLLAYWVGQRTREIGVRAALGAGRRQLMGLVVGQGVMLALVGVIAGGLAAVALGRFVENQLYSVQPLDIVSFAATAGVMILTAFIASLVPALRALRIDPINALRGE
jgi:predicted permease